MYIATSLEKAIYEIMCDETIFPIGFRGYFKDIRDKIVPIIKTNDQFKQIDDEKISHSICQVLQTRNNSIRNTNYKDFQDNQSIIRDISSVRISQHKNLYVFGCML